MRINAVKLRAFLIPLILLGACTQAVPGSSVSPTAASEAILTPSSSASPEPSFTEATVSVPLNGSSQDVVLGNYTYYLDTSKVLTDGKETGYMLCRRDNTSEDHMNLLSCSITALGKHLYFLTWSGKSEDFLTQVNEVNSFYRLDGIGERTLISSGRYMDDISNALCVSGTTLYFTKYNDSAIYKTDLDCENIERIPVVLPEKNEPLEYCKKFAHCELFKDTRVSLNEDGLISFMYFILNKDNIEYFYGYYTISADNNNLVKTYSVYCNNVIEAGGSVYYLDFDNPIESEDTEDPLFNIHSVKQDGSEDKNLNIQCFQFDIAGEYIYADSDIEYGDFVHWNTYRYNINGTGKKILKYSDMKRYSENDKLYFTTFDDKIIYIADTSCGNIKKIKIKIPDDKTLYEKIGTDYELGFITVTDYKENWLYFDYSVTDTGPYTYYSCTYRLDLKNGRIEKADTGKFFSHDYGETNGE